MKAAVDCVLEHASPPSELRLAWQCQKWSTLPESGGLLDQDYRTMRRMNTLLGIHNAVTRIYSLPGKEIHKLSENDRVILRALMDEGLIFHA